MWSNGNGRRKDDCAADGYASSIYTISVGAMSVHGDYSPFDEPCSAKMTTTYVTDRFGSSKVVNYTLLYPLAHANCINMFCSPLKQVTTSGYGGCTFSFGGTSSSTPMTAGIIALALEAK